jgi:hypothetical protein
LVEEDEELEAQQPLEATPRLVLTSPTPGEESKIEVIEAPLVKKRKLVKRVEVAALVAETKNVANFLAARRKQAPKPSVAPLVSIKAFLANDPSRSVR